MKVRILFERVPSTDGAPHLRFVEVEDAHGYSLRLGEWIETPHGPALEFEAEPLESKGNLK